MGKTTPTLPRGMRDFAPDVLAKRNYILRTISTHFINYGFSQIETSAMENLSVLNGKYGEESDQLLYKVLRSGEYLDKTSEEDYQKGQAIFTQKISDKGLRYDLTVPFARFVAMNKHALSFPFKRFQIQPVWRADRPQKGRYREFYQCDADIVGSKSNWYEAELTLLLGDVFMDLKLNEYIIKLNHRELLFEMAKYVGLADQMLSFCVEMDKLEKIGVENVFNNLIALKADSTKLEKVMSVISTKEKHSLLENLSALFPIHRASKELNSYFEILNRCDKQVKIELDATLARGLSYYTGMIFEVKSTSVKMGSLCGGGRYDDLTDVFGLKGMSGVGISFGLDRIYDVLEELALFPENIASHLDVYVLHFSEETFCHAQQLVMKLRDNGIRSDIYPELSKIRKQFEHTDKINARYSLVVGEMEMENEVYVLKNMKNGVQQNLKLNEIISYLKKEFVNK